MNREICNKNQPMRDSYPQFSKDKAGRLQSRKIKWNGNFASFVYNIQQWAPELLIYVEWFFESENYVCLIGSLTCFYRGWGNALPALVLIAVYKQLKIIG